MNDVPVVSQRQPRRRRWHQLALVLGALLVADGAMWLIAPLPHPYSTDLQQRDRDVGNRLHAAPANRYLPSYHAPVAVQLELDGVALPGVSGTHAFTINQFGFRSSRMTTIAKPHGTVRTFCIGGSTTECLYLDDADAWPEVVQRELAAVCPTLDVVNAGRSGDATRDHVALLAQRIVVFEPDVVLVLAGINDMFQQMAPDYSPLRDDGRALAARPSAPGAGAVKSLLCDVSQIARAVVLLARRLQGDGRSGAVEQDAHGGWVARERAKWQRLPWADRAPHDAPQPEFEQNLRTLIGICRAHGAVPVLVTQPALWGTDDAAAERLFWRRPPDERRVPQQVLWQVLERFNDVTRRVAAAAECPLVDLARLLPKQPALFYDDDHVNTAGAKVAGETVATALRALPEVAGRLQQVR